MIKGYLGDICFNGKLLKNYVVSINPNGRVKSIEPFSNECEGIILCDDVIIIIASNININSEIKEEIKESLKEFSSISDFLKSHTYIKYGSTDIINSQLFIL